MKALRGKSRYILEGMATYVVMHFLSVDIAIASVALVAFSKIFTDWYDSNSKVDWLDAVAIVMGGVLGYFCVNLLASI